MNKKTGKPIVSVKELKKTNKEDIKRNRVADLMQQRKYFQVDPSELIFLTEEQHKELHGAFRTLMKKSRKQKKSVSVKGMNLYDKVRKHYGKDVPKKTLCNEVEYYKRHGYFAFQVGKTLGASKDLTKSIKMTHDFMKFFKLKNSKAVSDFCNTEQNKIWNRWYTSFLRDGIYPCEKAYNKFLEYQKIAIKLKK